MEEEGFEVTKAKSSTNEKTLRAKSENNVRNLQKEVHQYEKTK